MASVPTTKPPPGFTPWFSPYFIGVDRPCQFEAVEIWRIWWMEPQIMDPSKMHPAMNVAGMYWRPIQKDAVSAP